MPLTIAATSTPGYPQAFSAAGATAPAKAYSAKVAAQPSASASSAQQEAALNRMVATYTRDQAHGADARTLATLAQQIMAAAKALGRQAVLPHPPPTSEAAPKSAKADAAAGQGTLDMTA